MCGRFTVTHQPAEVQGYFELPELPAFLGPRYNVAPSQPVPVVGLKPDGETRGPAMPSWGLLPEWANSPKDGRFPNARAETVDAKPAFRDAFRHRRCLMVASGFYEWKAEGRAKRPHHFRLWDGSVFAFAGLWSAWGQGKEKVVSCCLLTTTPNAVVGAVHDRMPVILPRETYADWLGFDTPATRLKELLKPYPAGEVEGYEVGPYVSNARNEGPACVRPLAG